MRIRTLTSTFIFYLLVLPSFGQKTPILHVTFDESAMDSGKSGKHGSLYGAEIATESKIGKGAVFLDGIDDYVAFPEGIYFAGSYSISLWSKPLEAKEWTRFMDFNQNEPDPGNAVTWLIGRNDTGENDMWFDQWIAVKGKVVESIVDFNRTSPADAYLNYNIEIGNWHHYVITYEPDSTTLREVKNTKGDIVPLNGLVKLYVDGQFRSSSTYCLSPQKRRTVANWLGRSRYTTDPYYHGFLDDFRIYDIALKPNEVQELFQIAE